MNYADAQTAGVGAITAIGERGLAIFLAAIVLAGSVFLIRWGFRIGKNALDGNLSAIENIGSNNSIDDEDAWRKKFWEMNFKDGLEADAYWKGHYKNKEDGINI